jgi:hypothetical protein
MPFIMLVNSRSGDFVQSDTANQGKSSMVDGHCAVKRRRIAELCASRIANFWISEIYIPALLPILRRTRHGFDFTQARAYAIDAYGI